MKDSLSWHAHGNQARLELNDLDLRVDTNRLQQGLHSVQYQGRPLSGYQLFKLNLPDLQDPVPANAVGEVYPRGKDLVTTYLPSSPNRFAPQVYWRAQASDDLVGVEVIISMQTDMLESSPLIESRSEVRGQTACCFGVDCETSSEVEIGSEATVLSTDRLAPVLLIRDPQASFSYVEMAYPTDPSDFWIRRDDGDGLSLGFRLRQEHLEKGVIRRFRVSSWFVPRENDVELATQRYHALLQSAPPLTT